MALNVAAGVGPQLDTALFAKVHMPAGLHFDDGDVATCRSVAIKLPHLEDLCPFLNVGGVVHLIRYPVAVAAETFSGCNWNGEAKEIMLRQRYYLTSVA